MFVFLLSSLWEVNFLYRLGNWDCQKAFMSGLYRFSKKNDSLPECCDSNTLVYSQRRSI